jgi:molybdenum cofactor biosynthesis protein B
MPSDSTQQHREQAEALGAIRVAILTFSDTRALETDKSGALIRQLAEEAGFTVALHEVLKDDPGPIRDRVRALADGGELDVVLTNGGTGIAPRDGAFEAIDGLLERRLPGFGEIFRMLSWEEVGPAAMLSRAVGGLRGRTLVFSMPGSSNAVGLAMRRLVVPELRGR